MTPEIENAVERLTVRYTCKDEWIDEILWCYECQRGESEQCKYSHVDGIEEGK